jgi:hypothetical protein
MYPAGAFGRSLLTSTEYSGILNRLGDRSQGDRVRIVRALRDFFAPCLEP